MISTDLTDSHEAKRRDWGDGVNTIIRALDLHVKHGHTGNVKCNKTLGFSALEHWPQTSVLLCSFGSCQILWIFILQENQPPVFSPLTLREFCPWGLCGSISFVFASPIQSKGLRRIVAVVWCTDCKALWLKYVILDYAHQTDSTWKHF